MKASIFSLLLTQVVTINHAWPGYKYIYKEQLYKLYHEHLYMYPENFAENIHWLEESLKADFANPLYALAKIENKKEWEWYRNMFLLHVNLLLVKNYLQWGNKYIKRKVYFYNEPWRETNIKSLQHAKIFLDTAKVYWEETKKVANTISTLNLSFTNLEEIQNWEDEYHRIMNKTLNYDTLISRELQLIETNIEKFETMDETTY